MPFEGVDWTPFDIISVDAYRSVEVADRFAAGIRSLVAQGKTVAITQFCSATYKGAADKGARGGEIIEWDKDAVRVLRLDGDYIRDEGEQAKASTVRSCSPSSCTNCRIAETLAKTWTWRHTAS
jgi:hypothetical protein